MATLEPTITYNLWVMDESDDDVYCEFDISYDKFKCTYTISNIHDISWKSLIDDVEYEYSPAGETFFIKKKDGFITFITPSNFEDCNATAEVTFTIPNETMIPIFKKIIADPTFTNPPTGASASISNN